MANPKTDGEKNAKEFFQELKAEHNLMQSVGSDLVKLANARGYKCTAEDLNKVLRRLWGATKNKGLVYSEPPRF